MTKRLTKPMRTVLLNIAEGRPADDGLITISTAMLNGVPARITAAASILTALRKRGLISMGSNAGYKITHQGQQALADFAKTNH